MVKQRICNICTMSEITFVNPLISAGDKHTSTCFTLCTLITRIWCVVEMLILFTMTKGLAFFWTLFMSPSCVSSKISEHDKSPTYQAEGDLICGALCALHNASTTQRVELVKDLAMRGKGVALSSKAFASILHAQEHHVNAKHYTHHH